MNIGADRQTGKHSEYQAHMYKHAYRGSCSQSWLADEQIWLCIVDADGSAASFTGTSEGVRAQEIRDRHICV